MSVGTNQTEHLSCRSGETESNGNLNTDTVGSVDGANQEIPGNELADVKSDVIDIDSVDNSTQDPPDKDSGDSRMPDGSVIEIGESNAAATEALPSTEEASNTNTSQDLSFPGSAVPEPCAIKSDVINIESDDNLTVNPPGKNSEEHMTPDGSATEGGEPETLQSTGPALATNTNVDVSCAGSTIPETCEPADSYVDSTNRTDSDEDKVKVLESLTGPDAPVESELDEFDQRTPTEATANPDDYPDESSHSTNVVSHFEKRPISTNRNLGDKSEDEKVTEDKYVNSDTSAECNDKPHCSTVVVNKQELAESNNSDAECVIADIDGAMADLKAAGQDGSDVLTSQTGTEASSSDLPDKGIGNHVPDGSAMEIGDPAAAATEALPSKGHVPNTNTSQDLGHPGSTGPEPCEPTDYNVDNMDSTNSDGEEVKVLESSTGQDDPAGSELDGSEKITPIVPMVGSDDNDDSSCVKGPVSTNENLGVKSEGEKATVEKTAKSDVSSECKDKPHCNADVECVVADIDGSNADLKAAEPDGCNANLKKPKSSDVITSQTRPEASTSNVEPASISDNEENERMDDSNGSGAEIDASSVSDTADIDSAEPGFLGDFIVLDEVEDEDDKDTVEVQNTPEENTKEEHEAVPQKNAASCVYFLKGRCRFGNKCRFNHVNEPGVAIPEPVEPETSNVICKHWNRGYCALEDDCKYRHSLEPHTGAGKTNETVPSSVGGTESVTLTTDEKISDEDKNIQQTHHPSAAAPLCKHYVKNGLCPLGDNCAFRHDADTTVHAASSVPQESHQTCAHFFIRGHCRFGDKCRNRHEKESGEGDSTTSKVTPSTTPVVSTDPSDYRKRKMSGSEPCPTQAKYTVTEAAQVTGQKTTEVICQPAPPGTESVELPAPPGTESVALPPPPGTESVVPKAQPNVTSPIPVLHRKTKPCVHFLRKGHCAYGDLCKFSHDKSDKTVQPASSIPMTSTPMTSTPLYPQGYYQPPYIVSGPALPTHGIPPPVPQAIPPTNRSQTWITNTKMEPGRTYSSSKSRNYQRRSKSRSRSWGKSPPSRSRSRSRGRLRRSRSRSRSRSRGRSRKSGSQSRYIRRSRSRSRHRVQRRSRSRSRGRRRRSRSRNRHHQHTRSRSKSKEKALPEENKWSRFVAAVTPTAHAAPHTSPLWPAQHMKPDDVTQGGFQIDRQWQQPNRFSSSASVPASSASVSQLDTKDVLAQKMLEYKNRIATFHKKSGEKPVILMKITDSLKGITSELKSDTENTKGSLHDQRYEPGGNSSEAINVHQRQMYGFGGNSSGTLNVPHNPYGVESLTTGNTGWPNQNSSDRFMQKAYSATSQVKNLGNVYNPSTVSQGQESSYTSIYEPAPKRPVQMQDVRATLATSGVDQQGQKELLAKKLAEMIMQESQSEHSQSRSLEERIKEMTGLSQEPRHGRNEYVATSQMHADVSSRPMVAGGQGEQWNAFSQRYQRVAAAARNDNPLSHLQQSQQGYESQYGQQRQYLTERGQQVSDYSNSSQNPATNPLAMALQQLGIPQNLGVLLQQNPQVLSMLSSTSLQGKPEQPSQYSFPPLGVPAATATQSAAGTSSAMSPMQYGSTSHLSAGAMPSQKKGKGKQPDWSIDFKIGEEIHSFIAKLVKPAFSISPNLWLTGKKYNIPRNCRHTDPPEINVGLFVQLPSSIQSNDNLLREFQKLFSKAITPIVEQVSMFGKRSQGISYVCRRVSDAITLLGYLCIDLSMKRRLMLKSALPTKYHVLCRTSNKITNFLFGDSLDADIRRIYNNNYVAESLGKDDPRIKAKFLPESTSDGEEIDDSVADMVRLSCSSAGNVDDLREKYKIPANCMFMLPPKLNPQIKKMLPVPYLEVEQTLRTIQLRIAEAMVPCMHLLESVHEKRFDDCLTLGFLTDSLVLVGNAVFLLNSFRLDSMKCALAPHLQVLCKWTA